MRGENHRVIAHHIAASERVHANLARCPFARQAVPAVANDFFQRLFAHARHQFRQRGRRAAGRVFLHPMMQLDDFHVEPRAEDFSSLARQPEQRVDSGRIVRRPDNRYL